MWDFAAFFFDRSSAAKPISGGASIGLKLRFQSFAILFVCSFVASTATGKQPLNDGETKYQILGEDLSEIIRYEIEQKSIPAFSIAVVVDGTAVFADGFGFEDAEKRNPATSKTIYRVGSVSKLLTDVALMQMVEAGQLDLDRPVVEYVPTFTLEDGHHDITLRQLIMHRAGIVREPPIGNYFDASEPTLQKTIESLSRTKLVYSPETRTKYSNAGVSVAGLAVENLSNQSHASVVQEKILTPLGMHSTTFEKDSTDHASVAAGWMVGYDRPKFPAPEFMLGTGPAGNLYSTVEDLAKFSMFVTGDPAVQILGSDFLDKMLLPGKSADGNDLPYGLGFRVSEFEGERRVGHGGAVYGYSTQLEILPDAKVAVCAAASLDGCNDLVTRLAEHALSSVLAIRNGKALPKYRRTTSVDAQRAKQLVGRYRESATGEVLEVDWIEQKLLLLTENYQRQLRSDEIDGSLVVDDAFGYGDKLLVEGTHLSYQGKNYVRMEEIPPPAAPPEMEELIGEYGEDHNILFILERNQRLYALIEWFYYYPLQQAEKDVFKFPDYGLYHGEGLSFIRNESGEIDSVVAAGIPFAKREVGTTDGVTFKIQRQLPIDELRELANDATPPTERGNFLPSQLVELTSLEPEIGMDIRYATTNNFMDTRFYSEAKAFAQRPAAEAAVRVHQKLKKRFGLGLLVHDAYRPWRVTKMFWDATPNSMRDFVANPANGSRHNRGCAIDLTLMDIQTRMPIKMVSGYDEFSQRSYPLYPGGTTRQRWYRNLLRHEMQDQNFQVYEFEWWHFDFDGWEKYRIGNIELSEVNP